MEAFADKFNEEQLEELTMKLLEEVLEKIPRFTRFES